MPGFINLKQKLMQTASNDENLWSSVFFMYIIALLKAQLFISIKLYRLTDRSASTKQKPCVNV